MTSPRRNLHGWTQEPLAAPWAGREFCHECQGKKVGWRGQGEGVGEELGPRAPCAGKGWCIVCGSAGQFPVDEFSTPFFSPSIAMIDWAYYYKEVRERRASNKPEPPRLS